MKFLLVAILALVGAGCADAQFKRLSAVEFNNQLQKTENALLLDVRTAGEFQRGHLENAVNMDVYARNFTAQAQTLPKDRPIFVYCLTGARSSDVAGYLTKNGYTVVDLSGGINSWARAKLPIVAANAATKGKSVSWLQSEIIKNESVVVNFFAPWCAPCKTMEPTLLKTADSFKDSVHLVRLDLDENQTLAEELQIAGVPLTLFFKNGKLIAQKEGALSDSELKTWFATVSAKS